MANTPSDIKNIRLRPSIVLLFVILVVPIFTAMLWFTYTTNDKMTRMNARELMERFRFEAIANTHALLVPLESLVSAAATLGSEQQQFYREDKSWAYLHSILSHSETISSVYVGFEDGTFRMVIRTPAGLKIQDKTVMPDSDVAYRWLDRSEKTVGKSPTKPPVDAFIFKNKQDQTLGNTQEVATYDPRQRNWYKDAAINRKVTLSEPYVFSSTGLPGITIAAPFFVDGKLVGVVGTDITLDNLSQFLASRVVSPHAMSLIIDDSAKVIANSNLKEQAKRSSGKIELKNLGMLESDLPALAMVHQSKVASRENFTFTHPETGEEYAASFSSFSSNVNKNWQVLILAPLDDFSGPLKENNRRLLFFGSLAIALQVLFIYFLSRLIARPLERLERKVNNVRNLDISAKHIENTSPIREISSLIRAVDTLDHAVRSFAAFVPVGLVKQLIASDQELQLGGQSRFLTIMFCDVEAFSTLAENSPSQELLMRVSAYLEAVTLSVNEEKGTIDKFIGDAVMAFWGAPDELHDHVWHACAAAIRISQRMEKLNAKWMAEGLEPLRIRTGIHCDAVLVGNIGSMHRMSYTVMGDGVNLASRLEGINNEYGTRICISQSVYREVGERLCLRPIDEVAVKGRRSTLQIYELMGLKNGAGSDSSLDADEHTVELCKLTALAHQSYTAGHWQEALTRYQDVLARFPKDALAMTMSQRCRNVLTPSSPNSPKSV